MEELRIEENGNLGPIDSSRIPRFAGAATYARLPRLDQVARADSAQEWVSRNRGRVGTALTVGAGVVAARRLRRLGRR